MAFFLAKPNLSQPVGRTFPFFFQESDAIALFFGTTAAFRRGVAVSIGYFTYNVAQTGHGLGVYKPPHGSQGPRGTAPGLGV